MKLKAIKLLALACVFGLVSIPVSARQTTSPVIKGSKRDPVPPASGDADDDEQTSPREDMLKDVEIKRREAVYKENLDRAKEAAQLGTEVLDAYKAQKSLGAAELKKIARIEKLAKSVRNDVGGDDDDTALKDPPARLEAALQKLAELCADFRKQIEKTPRYVVSAGVINSANELIELTRHIKTLRG
ncbi:MAG: hypothetical protein ACJ741_21110 [Pyrinomonadaceae bacterium]